MCSSESHAVQAEVLSKLPQLLQERTCARILRPKFLGFNDCLLLRLGCKVVTLGSIDSQPESQ